MLLICHHGVCLLTQLHVSSCGGSAFEHGCRPSANRKRSVFCIHLWLEEDEWISVCFASDEFREHYYSEDVCP